MNPAIKSGLLRVWSVLPVVPGAFGAFLRDRATIFMLHRFHDPDLDVAGCDPALLARALAFFRGHHYDIVPLDELFRRLDGDGPSLKRAVAFTIDDGYYDQAELAAPVFAEYDCPVTTFVTTGFLDGDLWFWWDQVEFVFATTPRSRVSVALSDAVIDYGSLDAQQRRAARLDFVSRCKRVPDVEKLEAISRLADAAEVELPTRPPPQYAPMSWDQVRSCEGGTMSFGPHTVTHPVLSQTGDDQARREVLESWSRLRTEARRPVPVFCYPNGQAGDFGAREITVLREAGFLGAVVGSPGYAHGRALRDDPDARFGIPRFVWPAEFALALQYASGLERFKQLLRRAAA